MRLESGSGEPENQRAPHEGADDACRPDENPVACGCAEGGCRCDGDAEEDEDADHELHGVIMALTAQQRKLARRLVRIGNRVGATPMEIKAALETGYVESGFRNLSGGDADSAGWRQERASLYKNPTNVRASARRFYQEAAALRGRYRSAGELAAAVQRPAAQYRGRYAQASGVAESLLGGSGGGSQRPQSPSVVTDPGSAFNAGDPAAVSAVVESLLGQKPQRPVSSTPGTVVSFDARKALPMASQAPVTNGGPAKSTGLTDALSAVRTLGQTLPAVASATTQGGSGSTQGSTSGGSGGKVKVASGANRPGADLNPAVIKFVRQVAGMYGRPLTIGTGTNHNRLTVNGTVSDHWSGNGADVPLTGRALIRAGQDALIAAGMPRAKARRQKGGGFNVGGWQIIFNTDAPGWGDHTTHLHVGRRR